MTLSKTYVDGFLVEWEAGEYEAQVKSMRQKSQRLVHKIPRLATSGQATERSTAARAQAVRERLARTVLSVPEVMVKITSSCKGMGQIGRHLDYISRKGQIEVEDQDGLSVIGKDQLDELKGDWRVGGPETIPTKSSVRDTFNIVFSMPAHTEEVSLKRAVRAFAQTTFEGHQFVFAYHTPSTDPDPNPPAHPHIHLSVKSQGCSGRRLNPRKADLQRWREDFASQLRAHGIEANATTRLARLKRERGIKRAVLALRERGEGPLAGDQRSVEEAKSRKSQAIRLEADRLTYLALASETLQRSEDKDDRTLGKALADRFAGPTEIAVGHKLAETRLPERDI